MPCIQILTSSEDNEGTSFPCERSSLRRAVDECLNKIKQNYTPCINAEDYKRVETLVDLCDELCYLSISQSSYEKEQQNVEKKIDNYIVELGGVNVLILLLLSNRPSIIKAALNAFIYLSETTAAKESIVKREISIELNNDILCVITKLLDSFPRREDIIVLLLKLLGNLVSVVIEELLKRNVLEKIIEVVKRLCSTELIEEFVFFLTKFANSSRDYVANCNGLPLSTTSILVHNRGAMELVFMGYSISGKTSIRTKSAVVRLLSEFTKYSHNDFEKQKEGFRDESSLTAFYKQCQKRTVETLITHYRAMDEKSAVLEICKTVLSEENINPEIMVCALSALGNISEIDECVVTLEERKEYAALCRNIIMESQYVCVLYGCIYFMKGLLSGCKNKQVEYDSLLEFLLENKIPQSIEIAFSSCSTETLQDQSLQEMLHALLRTIASHYSLI